MNSADFEKLISKQLAPFLKQDDWNVNGLDFTKQVNNVVHVITIQLASSEDKFCIEMGVHFDFLPLIIEKELSKLKTWDLEIRKRLTPTGESDYWWYFPKNEQEEKVLIEEISQLIKFKAGQYFNRYEDWTKTVSELKTEDIGTEKVQDLFPMLQTKASLMLARMNLHLKQHKRAVEFAKFGLMKIKETKNSPRLRHEFEEIIEKANSDQ